MIYKNVLAVFFFSFLFAFLFHNESLGLNVLIFEGILVVFLLISKQYIFNNLKTITFGIGIICSAVFTVVSHSSISYLINLLLLIVFIGLLIFPEAKSVINSSAQTIYNIPSSLSKSLNAFSSSKVSGKGIGSLLWKIRIFLLPMFIIGVFLMIYKASNPKFNEVLHDFFTSIGDFLSNIFAEIDLSIVLTFILGLFISINIFYRSRNQSLCKMDQDSSDFLIRHRNGSNNHFGTISLKNEYKAGIFLLFSLNLLILIFNVIDIQFVWLGFKWEGQYLKQFVHEGTYLLILSILISIALVLYFFRGNLNFLSVNKGLKTLSYIWLIQNAFLCLSVAMRNIYYIDYFALAYKRIGVFVFLLITLYGLYTVFLKVKNKKSTFYLFRTNAYVALVILTLTSFVNWDNVIAKYNFAHSNKSFLHLDFLSTLSDKTLPILDVSLNDLKEIEQIQNKKFSFDEEYMSIESYHGIIQNRKMNFKLAWEQKGFLSWNLAESRAYNKLFPN